MKQLISLILIISIAVISWSSYAKSTEIRVNLLYSQPSSAINSVVLTPSLTKQHINESFGVTSNQSTNKSHNFFELAIIFNEKLQQFIAFFTHFGDETEEVASNNFSATAISPENTPSANISSAKNSKSTVKKCKASS